MIRIVDTRFLKSFWPVAGERALRARIRQFRARAVQMALSYSTADLEETLQGLGIGRHDSVVMHSAFSHFNGFQGEPRQVIDCLLDVIGPGGHLFMMSMAYTGSSRDYLGEGTPFDVRRTPSRMGILSEAFRRRKGVVRSANPLHPVLAWGPRAEWVVAGHEDLPHSCGKGSPSEKMLELGTKALFFDVDLHYLTFMHYLEDLFQDSAPVPVYAAEPLSAEIIDRTGRRKTVSVFPFSREASAQRNFAVVYDALVRKGSVKRDRIGNTRMQVVSLQDVVGCATSLLERGIHIYGRPGQKVRVKPSHGGFVRGSVAIVSEEIRTGRAARDLRRLARTTLDAALVSYRERSLPAPARRELALDRAGLRADDPGIDACVSGAIDWLRAAQDRSADHDGGVARHYSFISGWSGSYPACTGCIVPTLLDYAERTDDDALRARAQRMIDWLVSIQLPIGAFRGGVAGAMPARPVTFNTGQVLLGLAAGARALHDPQCEEAMHRAARWLVETQDEDGCWRSHQSPFAVRGVKAYDTHVAWGLLEAARLAPDAGYERAALASVRWALGHQRDNGWFARCCLTDPTQPLSHTIGYALRGLVEAHRFTRDGDLLLAARRTADPLMRVMGADGFLPGRLRSDWSAGARWACLSGTAQIAICWLLLYDATGEEKYLDAARTANRYVRRTIRLDATEDTRGGVKGAFPVNGSFGRFKYVSWAAKLFVDANLMEQSILGRRALT